MFEKIFQKLKDSRATNSSISDRTLETLAHSLVSIITTDEQLTAYNAKTALESMDGNIRATASSAIKKAEEAKKIEAEKAKEAEAAKKAQEVAKKSTQPTGEEVPSYVQAIIDQNKLLADNLAKIQSDVNAINTKSVKQTRQEKLQAVLKDIPDYVANPIKSSFAVASFSDEDSFAEYLQNVQNDTNAFKDAAKAKGLNTFSPSKEVKKPENTGETPSLKTAREIINKQKEKQNETNPKQ